MPPDTQAAAVPPQPTEAQAAAPVPTPAPAPAPEPAAEPAPAAAPESWARPDWRESYAKVRGGDEKLVNRLSRYSSPDAALDALVSMQTKLSAGELRVATPFPANGSDEQKAEWRRGNGIPDKPENYKVDLGDGLVVGEQDKPIVDSFLKAAHSANMPATQVNSILKWYFKDLVEGETSKIAEEDMRVTQEVDNQLRTEWGADYKKNKLLIESYIDSSGPPGLKDMLFSARLADGTPLASNLNVLRWLADRAREFNPTLALVPGDPSTAAKTISEELSNLQAMMGKKDSEYWKGPRAQWLQERYRKLVEARDGLSRAQGQG